MREIGSQTVAALLRLLRFPHDEPVLPAFDDAAWRELLAFCDRAQLTLALAERAPETIPEWVRTRLAKNVADNTQRISRVREAYDEIKDALGGQSIEFVVLKGFTHSPGFIRDLRFRPQYDIDLYIPHPEVFRARDAILQLAYEPIEWPESLADHLPTMIRKTGWRWRGDYFDPDIPIAVELHYRFWDRATERFGPEGLEDFWTRREGHRLDRVDTLGYAALHLLRHLFRGDMRPFRVYEMASFLANTSGEGDFWRRWRETHDEQLRSLEALCFHLAEQWFQAPIPDAAQAEIDRLPPGIQHWFGKYALAPLENLFRPNKHELWLHFELLSSWRDRWTIARRRLLPASLPIAVDAVHASRQETRLTAWIAIYLGYTRQLLGRMLYHARVLLPALWHGTRWIVRQSPARTNRSNRATAASRSR
jgi:hypothetical protein